MTQVKLFYSWQSWSPRERNFIERVLLSVIARLNQVRGDQSSIVLDRDTLGETGSPAFADTIVRKIGDSDIFVCDVTLVGTGDHDDKRRTPNPNVMLELGHAIRKPGWDRIICVLNEAYGPIADLPSDIRHRIVRGFSLTSRDNEDEVLQQLAAVLYRDIEAMIQNVQPVQTLMQEIEDLIGEPNGRRKLQRILNTQFERSLASAQTVEFYERRQGLLAQSQEDNDRWESVFSLYSGVFSEFLNGLVAVLWERGSEFADDVREWTLRLIEPPQDETQKTICWRFIPSLLLLYSVGIVATYRQSWELLNRAMFPGETYIPGERYRGPYLQAIAFGVLQFYQEAMKSSALPPIGVSIFTSLRPSFLELLHLDRDYETAFDMFEMLLSLAYLRERVEKPSARVAWIYTVGETAFEMERSYKERIEFWKHGGSCGDKWDLIGSGLLGTSIHKLRELLELRNRYIEHISLKRSFPLRLADYLEAFEQGAASSESPN